MALIIGHSQTKYLQDYLDNAEYSVFSYPGYNTQQFYEEEVLLDVAPFFSAIVVVVGANDMDRKSPRRIADGMFALCRDLRAESPRSTVFVSTVLPRCQNGYEGSSHSTAYLQRWNADAREVNRRLREHAHQHDWIRVIEHPQFYTLFGVNKRLLSRDALHLSFEGTHIFANNIDDMVRDCIPLKLQTAASTEESKTQCLTNNDQTITKPTSNRTCTKTDLHNGQNSLHKRDTNCIFESPNDSLDKKKEIYSSSEKTCSSKNKLCMLLKHMKNIFFRLISTKW